MFVVGGGANGNRLWTWKYELQKFADDFGLTISVRSPKDFQTQMHLYNGALYGLSPATSPLDQFSHVSPIPGLFLAGQTTYPGFGVGPASISGILSANALLRSGT